MKHNKIGKVGGNITDQLIGAAIGGGINAVFDNFIADKLPQNLGGVPVAPIVKVAAGIGLPMIVKGNSMVNNGGTALLACGMSDLISKVAFGKKSEVKGFETAYVGATERVPFPLYSAGIEDTTPAAKTPNKKDFVG